jgi:acetyl esterase/lipase
MITSPPTPFAYSKWTYLAANSDLIEDVRDRELLLAIADERRLQPPAQWTISGDALGADARAILALCESHTAAEFDARLSEAPLVRNRTEQLSPSRYFDLNARLIIVHIFSDPSIPSEESVKMAAAARARGIPYSLTILNMYGHTRPEWPDLGIRSLFAFYLPEGWKFIRALNEILSYA